MSKQSKSAVDFGAAAAYRSDTAPPPYSSSSTSANAAPPYASSCTTVKAKESVAEFIARMGLFDGQGKNPDILSIIIIANLVAANPDTKELTLSKTEIPTLRIKSNSFIEQVKAGIKKQDPGRSDEWDKLDSDFIHIMFQYIVLHQDTEGNPYKAWIPICHNVRPSFRAYGKNPLYCNTIGTLKIVRDARKLEKLRKKKSTTGAKEFEAFMAVWLQFCGWELTKTLEIQNASRPSKRASKS